MGLEDGMYVGTAVGTEVGNNVGSIVGIDEGVDVGLKVLVGVLDDGTEEGIDVGVEDGMHVGTTDGYEDGIKEGTEDGQEAGSPVTPSSCNCFPSPSANCLMYSFHSMSPLSIPTPSLLSLSSKSPSSARRFALLLNSASTNRKSKVTRRIVASPYCLN